MSLLLKAKPIDQKDIDGIYVIYGAPGSGKTSLASTFPKTKEAPMLFLDVLEGGTGSIDYADREHLQVLDIQSFEDFDAVITDLLNGYVINSGVKVPLRFSTIVIDTVTQLEYILKEYLKKQDKKSNMTLQLWGQNKDNQDFIYNTFKMIHAKTGANIVLLAHEKELKDDTNPEFNRIIPSLMTSAARSLAAKASFVWYTKIEKTLEVDQKTNEAKDVNEYLTTIDAHPYLDTKTRKPVSFKIPQKIKDLTYPKFKKNVLDKMYGKDQTV
jgi:GTPase SAR1 family protein